jgi:RNA polymerase subunit RPABC4/transcription elongation factor Spt4
MISAPDIIVRKHAELTDYSFEELKRFRKEFSAEIKAHQTKARRFAVPILILFVAGFGAVFYSFLLFQPPLTWLFVAGFGLVALGLALMAVTTTTSEPDLVCPACHNYFIDEIRDCCPECGSTSLGMQDWRGGRRCNTCGKNLRTGKSRNFKYKACTSCGVFLYKKGL